MKILFSAVVVLKLLLWSSFVHASGVEPVVLDSPNARAYIVPPLARHGWCARCVSVLDMEFEKRRLVVGGYLRRPTANARLSEFGVKEAASDPIVARFVALSEELGVQIVNRGPNLLFVNMPVRMSLDRYQGLKAIQGEAYLSGARGYNPETSKPYSTGESLAVGALLAGSAALHFVFGVPVDGVLATLPLNFTGSGTFEMHAPEGDGFPNKYVIGPVPPYAVSFDGVEVVEYRSLVTQRDRGPHRLHGEIVIGIRSGASQDELDDLLARSLIAASGMGMTLDQLKDRRAKELVLRKQIRAACLADGGCE